MLESLAIASKVEFAAKVLVLIVALPIVVGLLGDNNQAASMRLLMKRLVIFLQYSSTLLFPVSAPAQEETDSSRPQT